jgi:hypothetical protein
MRVGEIGENFSLNITQLVAEGDTVVALAPPPGTARAPASPPK